ncbi:thermonuclease family protein [Leptolyngbya sp. FACHB-711]|uniref:thermonuclease family protein n=1 Tax=unclassified Leptolyngbya TaxID=2650499 RepID=UPI0016860FE3|nr:thermonuclease family protein [Leptolyngbya sp. FACHB-711]MBD1851183.1 thermonuclease family protein [Cyanobacteria bacterium FACHB-502]MBD2023041.1 thermonuclease family protein [Leptolyngbya sp. FACHB-711]
MSSRCDSVVGWRVYGDTLRVRTGSQTATIRLAYVDAPEQDQTGGDAATQRLKDILPSGEKVQLRVVDIDRYGKTVAEVY